MVIIDTTVWIDYLNGASNPETEWLDRELTRQRLGLTDLILCEVLQGIHSEPQARRVLRNLQHFEIFETGTIALAIAAAHNSRYLRTRGLTVRKTIDCVIATFCLVGHHTLLHRDRDFDPFEAHLGLRVLRLEPRDASG